MVRTLIQAGADVDAGVQKGDSKLPTGTTPLIMAAQGGHEGIARLLIDAGADVNYVMPESTSSVSGISALIFAANQGSESLVRLLIDAGADVNYKVPGRRGTTALKVACGRGHKDTAKLLRKAGAKR